MVAAMSIVAALVGCARDEGAVTVSMTALRPLDTTSVTATPAPFAPADFVELGRRSVVRLHNDGCSWSGVGTAFMSADGELVTNHHVVEGHAELEYSTWDGTVHPLDAIPLSAPEFDLARIDATGAALTPVPTRDDRVAVGEPLAVVGYPGGGELSVVGAVAQGYEPWTGGVEHLRLDVPGIPGSSGSPVLDRRGRVVGVLAANDSLDDQALVVPWSKLRFLPAARWRPVEAC